MRYVIDTNAVNDAIAVEFLQESKGNTVILPYEVAFEAAATGTVEDYVSQFGSLFEFADQVEVLFPYGDIVRMDSNMPDMAGRMIDSVQTASFRANAHEIINHGPHYEDVIAHLREGQSAPSSFRAASQKRAELAVNFLGQFRSFFSERELASLSKYEPITGSFATKVYDFVRDETVRFYETAGITAAGPRDMYAMMNNCAYRHNMVNTHHIMELLGKGAVRRAAKKVRNDTFDIIISTLATYYDGLITMDQDMVIPHISSRLILAQNGGDAPLFDPTRIVIGAKHE